MFKFRRSHAPLRDARSAQRWLATLPFNDPLVVQREVLRALGAAAERNARRTPSVLAAVFRVDAQTTALVRTLMTQYTEIANRSSKLESQLWRALFDLTQGFLACYAAFAREIVDHGHHSRWQTLLPELIARQVVHLGRDAKIRLYRCEPWISSKWAELHAVFTRACSLQFERQPLLLAPGAGSTTIEREYLVALFLQQADPGNMTPRQIEWIATRLEEWCRPLRFTLEPTAAATFYVDLASSVGLKRRSVGALEGRVLFVDARPLHALLLQNRSELEQALKGEPRNEKTAPQREQLDLFVTLCSRLDPEFKPLARRGERIPASGAVDAIVGFNNISGFLADEKTVRAAEFNSTRSFASTMDLATFGRSRVEPDASRRHRAPAACRVRRARRAVGNEGHERVRIPAARADEHRHRGDAQHARRRASARREQLGARNRPPHAPPFGRQCRDRIAADREHAGGSQSDRAAQAARRRLLGRRRTRSAGRAQVRLSLPLVQPAPRRAARAVADHPARRVSAVQALHAADVGCRCARSGTGACSSSTTIGCGR